MTFTNHPELKLTTRSVCLALLQALLSYDRKHRGKRRGRLTPRRKRWETRMNAAPKTALPIAVDESVISIRGATLNTMAKWATKRFRELASSDSQAKRQLHKVEVHAIAVDRSSAIGLKDNWYSRADDDLPAMSIQLDGNRRNYWPGDLKRFYTQQEDVVIGVFDREKLLFEYVVAPVPTNVKPRKHFEAFLIRLRDAASKP
jgi:hypothetical protein